LISLIASVMPSRPGVPMKAIGPVSAPIAPIVISVSLIPASWARADGIAMEPSPATKQTAKAVR
jgi:hypothetical protein